MLGIDHPRAGTRAERLASAIADAIVAGEYGPGSKLDEQALAERHGVSRTPVREALRKLELTGLVEVRPHRGAVVASLTAEKLSELFVAMGEIEATCARLAAQCMTPFERRALGAVHESMGTLAEDGLADAYVAANVHFHELVYAGAHNAVLADVALGLRRRLSPFRQAQFRLPGRLGRSHKEHGEVVRAVLGGDAAGAHGAMLHHVTLVEMSVDALVATRRNASTPAG